MQAFTGFAKATLLTLTLAIVAFSAQAATYVPSAGNTRVTPSTDLINALGSLGVELGKVKPGKLTNKGIAIFPITGGAMDLDSGKSEIIHSGGLSLTAGETRVVLNNFIIDTTGTSPVLTGTVIVTGELVGRLVLFDVDLSKATIRQKRKLLDITNAELSLNAGAAAALNGIFGVTAFTEGFPIGTANIFARNLRAE